MSSLVPILLKSRACTFPRTAQTSCGKTVPISQAGQASAFYIQLPSLKTSIPARGCGPSPPPPIGLDCMDFIILPLHLSFVVYHVSRLMSLHRFVMSHLSSII